MFGRFALALAASASMLPLAMPAAAQEAAAEEEIVVTAQKREELLREVPQSVTAITEETLERTQANNFSDYVGRIPGMALSGDQPGNQRVTLRGLDTQGVAATIGTYIDETPFGSSTALVNGGVLAIDLDPYDIQRIEVLRGPQGTLYGANALGGLIKFVTVDPSTEGFEGRVQATGETTEDGDESWGVRGLANIPLGDRAALRVSGWQRSQGGFIDDPDRGASDVDSVDISGLRAKFLLDATDNLSIRLTAMTQNIVSDASSSVNYFPVPLEPVARDLEQSRAISEVNDVTYNIFNGTVDWDLGWASLVSSSSYNELEQNLDLDSSAAFGTPSFIDNAVAQDKFTQEFRLASPSVDDGLEWLLGTYFARETGDIFQQVYLLTPPPVFSGLDVGISSEYTEEAVFGSATYHFGPQFDVSAGVRYSRNEQDVTQFGTAAPAGSADSEDEVTTYSLAPRWRVNENTMIYGRVATGYRPGGPNVLSAFGTIPATFGPDTATNYEVGVKTDIVDGLLRVDASVFHIDWDDIQLLISDGVVSGNSNGGTAISQGAEWTLTLTPTHGLTVLWAGAYTDAHLTSDTDLRVAPPAPQPPILTGGVDGDSLPYASEWVSSVDVDYAWSMLGGEAYIGGTWRYVGERMSGFDTAFIDNPGGDPTQQPPDDAQIELPAYDVIDLRAGIDFDRFGIELFAKNVGNESEPLSFGGLGNIPPSSPNPNGAASVLRPRTIGLAVSARF